MLSKREDQVLEILKTHQVNQEIFKRILMFMREKDLIVRGLDATELLKKKWFPIDLLFFVISAKYNNYLIDQNSFSSYTPAHMANTKSAIKRIRRISKQTAVNKARKSRYKNALKKMNSLIEAKKKSEALKFLPKLNSELMKIAKTGIVKKQNASRNVSRFTKKIASI